MQAAQSTAAAIPCVGLLVTAHSWQRQGEVSALIEQSTLARPREVEQLAAQRQQDSYSTNPTS